MSEISGTLKDVRLRIYGCAAIIMLAHDGLNPIKAISSIIGISTWWATITAIGLAFTIVWGNFWELAYFATVIFLRSILSIFYSSVEVLGKQNIPKHGPMIFTGNHMNQFVDGAIVFANTPNRVRFMVAMKSYMTNIVGFFARATGSIPVVRPQDSAKKGNGTVTLKDNKAIGTGTSFLTDLSKGDKIRIGMNAFGIKQIVSDTELILGMSDSGTDPSKANEQDGTATYDILGFVDQSDMYEEVQKALAQGQCLGLFPEGGSHDRTDLLPLKAGIASIAFGTLEKYKVNVPIVPVGLTYFRCDKFRSRVVVEFGAPILMTPEMAKSYSTDRRSAYKSLLSEVEDGMRKVIVTAPDYQVLKLIHTARRLYRKPAEKFNIVMRQEMSRRFSIAYSMILKKYKTLPSDLEDLKKGLEAYQDALDHWGLKDYQITDLRVPVAKIVYSFVHTLVVALLAFIPSLLLNFPVGIAAKLWAENMAKKDLARSKVKIFARDVIMSRKIIFSLGAIPVLWIVYFIVFFFFTPLSILQVILVLIMLPIFSYLGVTAVEAGVVNINDLRPAFLRMLPSYRKQQREFPIIREDLQKRVRAVCKKYGPELGKLYYDKTVDLDSYMKELKITEEDEINGDNEGSGEDESNSNGIEKKIRRSSLTTTEEELGRKSSSVDNFEFSTTPRFPSQQFFDNNDGKKNL